MPVFRDFANKVFDFGPTQIFECDCLFVFQEQLRGVLDVIPVFSSFGDKASLFLADGTFRAFDRWPTLPVSTALAGQPRQKNFKF